MDININITIALQGSDLEALGRHLATLLSGVTIAPSSHPDAAVVPTKHLVPNDESEPAKPRRRGPYKKSATRTDDPKRQQMPFAEFDGLVRSEIKRLAMDRRLPGRALWDAERDKRLPTLEAVRQRYNCNSMADLALEMGLEPPLHGNVKRLPT